MRLVKLSMFLLLAAQLPAQDNITNKRLLLNFSAGFINSSVIEKWVNIKFSYDLSPRIEQIPIPSLTGEIGAEVRMGQRNYLGLGYHTYKYRFYHRETTFVPYNYAEQLNFRGISLSHRVRLLNGKNLGLSLTNGFLHERFKDFKANGGYYYFYLIKKHNLSYQAKLDVELYVGDHGAFTLSPVFKIAVLDYAPAKTNTNYHPIGMGLLATWRIALF